MKCQKISRKFKVFKWLARLSGMIFCGFWLLAMGSAFYFEVILENQPLVFNEGFIITFVVLTATLGLIIGWRKETLGGAIMLLSGITLSAFAYNTAGQNKLFAVLTSGMPFVFSGALFIASSAKPR